MFALGYFIRDFEFLYVMCVFCMRFICDFICDIVYVAVCDFVCVVCMFLYVF